MPNRWRYGACRQPASMAARVIQPTGNQEENMLAFSNHKTRFAIALAAVFLTTNFFVLSSTVQSQTPTVCEDGVCPAPSQFATSGALEYATVLNSTNIFRHDPGFRGAEVIFRTTGTATIEQAKASWLRSPAHRKLLLSGAINDIRCVGSVCVGRSAQIAATSTAATCQTAKRITKTSTAKAKNIIKKVFRCR